jgi:hypothetical protein
MKKVTTSLLKGLFSKDVFRVESCFIPKTMETKTIDLKTLKHKGFDMVCSFCLEDPDIPCTLKRNEKANIFAT